MDAILLIARLMMAILFCAGGIPKRLDDPGARQAIAGLGFPAAGLLERLSGLGLVVGAALLLLGRVDPSRCRPEDVGQRARMMQAFAGNIGVVGGLLAFVAVGPGALAFLPAT